MSLRTGVVILPDLRWQVSRDRWREAEERGFHTAWTYDHLSWRTLRDGPWLGAIPLLTAAAVVTSTIRLGTLVTTPNFRHPALLAKDVMTLDDISGGRVELGIGAGGPGRDATALGGQAPSSRERFERFADFTAALDVMLREPSGSYDGPYFQAPEYRTLPGCVQQPRVPFTVAATGPRGLALTVRYASTWVTFGPLDESGDSESWFTGVARQAKKLDEACVAQGRDTASLRRMALVGLEVDWVNSSRSRWEDFTGRIAELGFTDVVVHWPRPDDYDLPGLSPDVFDAISAGSY
jgi:alkanesulfonate monooxygenase SsuD/methylene tetrahydromethanopterin reductase-like flavin-dependent oxidoreductase (luciferase family)